MNVFQQFHSRISKILDGWVAEGRLEAFDPDRFVVEPPRDSKHGDLSTNAAMALAREAKAGFGNPRALAEALAAALRGDAAVAGAEVAGPGFVNIRLRSEVLQDVLRACLAAGRGFGRPENVGSEGSTGIARRKVNVEYVSANPTGPMHVGHGRGAVFGDALANLLAFAGADVTREYYINDAGAQVDVLARSAFLRYREALGETIGEIPEGLYPGDYLKSAGAGLAAIHGPALLGQAELDWLPVVRAFAIDAMMAMIRTDLAALEIRHAVFFSERSLKQGPGGRDLVAETIEELRARNLIYEGRLPPPKGSAVEEWEDREQTLFRSTQFGDDVDRALIKSDGAYTYFASDIAYHKSKFARGFKTMIDVWGADHGGYVKRMQAAVTAVSDGEAELDVKLCQLVKLMRDGEPVKMSKRSGDFVTLREVVDEVGADPVRFMMLFRKNDAPLEFDLAKAVEQSKDNPVFYVQYAHARGRSVLRQGAAVFPDLDLSSNGLAEAALELLVDEGESELLRSIAQYPRQIESAATAHEPHRIAFYLHELASLFHSHWNKGKDQPHLRFVNEERRDLSHARLALTHAATVVLASGLQILGVGAPEEMR